LVCAVALMGGQYAVTGNQVFIWFAMGIVATDMFRYLNGPQMAKVRSAMRKNIARAVRESGEVPEDGGQADLALQASIQLNRTLTAEQTDESTNLEGGPGSDDETDRDTTMEDLASRVHATELQRRFFTRFPWYER